MMLYIFLILLAITTIVCVFIIDRQSLKLRRTNQVLAKEIAEYVTVNDAYMRLKGRTDLPIAQKDQESIPRLKTMNDEDLFNFLYVVIASEGLFLKPTFSLKDLEKRFLVSEERLIKAFYHGSRFGSFAAFIDECRLHESIKMLTSHPEIPLDEVAKQSGYANTGVFKEKFFDRYRLTPEEFLFLYRPADKCLPSA